MYSDDLTPLARVVKQTRMGPLSSPRLRLPGAGRLRYVGIEERIAQG